MKSSFTLLAFSTAIAIWQGSFTQLSCEQPSSTQPQPSSSPRQQASQSLGPDEQSQACRKMPAAQRVGARKNDKELRTATALRNMRRILPARPAHRNVGSQCGATASPSSHVSNSNAAVIQKPTETVDLSSVSTASGYPALESQSPTPPWISSRRSLTISIRKKGRRDQMNDKATKCSKCGADIVEGFLLDHNHGAHVVAQWVEGKPEASAWQRFWHRLSLRGRERRSLSAHRCTQCGFRELYASETPRPAPWS